ncbi:MAG: endonuclease/exonuclease/phosphatase family protein [Streptomycetales bacterium]
MADFTRQILAIDPQARVVVAGDLNDFEYSAAVQTLVGAGLTDLPGTLPDGERYTYVFEGNSRVLDHILLSSSLASAAHGYDVVHVNAEFADQLSDHDPQVARA